MYPAAEQPTKPKRRRKSLVRYLRYSLQWKWTIVSTLLLLVIGWTLLHIHYYNYLIDLQFNVGEAWAQVEAQLQRRQNIQRNLTKISGTYAQHEREVLTLLTKIRALSEADERRERMGHLGAGAGLDSSDGEPLPATIGTSESPLVPDLPPPAESNTGTATESAIEAATKARPAESIGLEGLGSKIELVAEQYPQLKLSKNLQQYSAAIVDTEQEIAEKTMAYNHAVNAYSTALGQFPGIIFGWICGFEPAEYFRPEQEARVSLNGEHAVRPDVVNRVR